MSVEVLHPGLLTTVQDAGRTGHLVRGIPPNGAMDRFALRAVNALLGNEGHEAVLEMYFPAGRLRFHEAAVVCLGGAEASVTLNGQPVPAWRPIGVPAGSEIALGERRAGFRMYLGVLGGWDIPEWLGSRSTNLMAGVGGYGGRALRAGDRLGMKIRAKPPVRNLPWSLSPAMVEETYRERAVRAVVGPEFDWLAESGQAGFFENPYAIANESNRTGYRLRGAVLERQPRELVSGAVAFGTVQLPPGGQPIVLMADHPVTGGYPRIAQVAAVDLPYLAQRAPGDTIRFTRVGQAEAERLYLKMEGELRQLRETCAGRMDEWWKRSI